MKKKNQFSNDFLNFPGQFMKNGLFTGNLSYLSKQVKKIKAFSNGLKCRIAFFVKTFGEPQKVLKTYLHFLEVYLTEMTVGCGNYILCLTYFKFRSIPFFP